MNLQSSESRLHSASSSNTNVSASRDSIPSSARMGLRTAKRKPSPLRLVSFSSELNESLNLSPSNVGGIGGSSIPPLRSPKLNGDVLPTENAQDERWVTPLDVHFSRQSRPGTVSRPHSYLPRLHFPEPLTEKTTSIVPTTSVGGIKSQCASIVSSEDLQQPSKNAEPLLVISSTFDFFPQQSPSKTARILHRAISPVSNEGEQRPYNIPVPPVPQEQSSTIDPNPCSEDDTIVSKQPVSAPKPSRPNDRSSEVGVKPQSHTHSIAASSSYSTTTSTLDKPLSQTPQNGSRSRSRGRSISSSHQRSRSSSTQTLSRTRDSVRRHSRRRSEEKRRSRDRDQIHYDPSSRRRNRSGSVQGRAVNFDRPRESPFSYSKPVANHSTNSGEKTGSTVV